jgi:hypothetical protein
MVPTAGLDGMKKRTNLLQLPGIKPRVLGLQQSLYRLSYPTVGIVKLYSSHLCLR